MKWSGAVVLLVGCNQVFGLEATKLAPVPDGSGNGGPSSCPTGVPAAFTGAKMLVASGCDSYTRDDRGTLAVTRCSGKLVEGPPDGPFTPAMFDVAQAYDAPRLAPGGTELYLRLSSPTRFVKLRRDAGVWSAPLTINLYMQAPNPGEIISVTTQGSGLDRRLIYHHNNAFWEEQVTAEDPSMQTWNITVGGFGAAQLGVTAIHDPMITPDGLRMVFRATTNTGDDVYTTQRAAIDTQWDTPATALYAGPDVENTPFLTSDCSRLYFTDASGALAYVTP